MGGLGSGRWGGHRKAWPVEACRRIDLARVAGGGAPAAGTLRWRDAGGAVVASVGYAVAAGDGGAVLTLRYHRITDPRTLPEPVVLAVALESTTLPRGGRRWWGRCPLGRAGRACGRRVGTLYLPPGATYFGCRGCHRLTYRSRQDHDPRVSRLTRDPAAVARLSRTVKRAGVVELGLLLRALTVLEEKTDGPRGRPGFSPATEDTR